MRATDLALATATIALLAGCGAASVRYPRRPIVWSDDDRAPFGPAPEARSVPYYWDAMDNLFFRPASDALALELPRESIDVNAWDEVPDSSFFVSRIGRSPMSPEEVARGACREGEGDPPGPWTIVGGKPAGASPGFVIRAADGVTYLLKTDRAGQPEQSTAADPIAAAIFHAAGYHVPCNRVVLFDPAVLVIGAGARTSRSMGPRRPIDEADVARVVAAATSAPGGRRRALLSRYVEGTPLGPWPYLGTWDADPNDVVPHEHRRELRATYVLDAWLDHWDSRQENTLMSWIESGSGGYVRHYLVDFGESLGMIQGGPRQAPRMGQTTFMDLGQIVADTLALGIARRAWDDRTPHPVLGYYDVEHFEPDAWAPQYWNGAIERRTERDCAWMARIVARFTDAHLRAAAALGAYSDPEVERILADTLIGRRDRVLERYLTRLSPLADPTLERAEDGSRRVCLTDLAVASGIRSQGLRRYRASSYADREPIARPVAARAEDAARVCVDLGALAPDRDGDYLVLDVVASSEGAETAGPLRMHLAIAGELEVVGLERPSSAAPP